VNYILTKPARDDLAEAAAYYESVSPGGGQRFLGRYEKAVARVLAFPRSLPKYHGRTRLCQIRRSDYGIVYLTSKDRIYVLGIVCLIRRPGYWKHRLKKFKPEVEEQS